MAERRGSSKAKTSAVRRRDSRWFGVFLADELYGAIEATAQAEDTSRSAIARRLLLVGLQAEAQPAEIREGVQ